MALTKVRGFTQGKLRLLFRDEGYRIGAEIGVASGRNSQQLFRDIPGLRLYCVDPWGMADCNEPAFAVKIADDVCYEEAMRRVSPFNATTLRLTSAVAAPLVELASLDFVYIDGNHHYDYVMEDLIIWSRRVRKGGMVAGHDYASTRRPEVGRAVDDYVCAHNIKNAHYTDEATPSFWWVKRW